MRSRPVLKPALAAIAIAAAASAPHGAMAQEAGIEGRRIAETIFATVDNAGAGQVHMGDIERFRRSVLAGMDSDGNGQVPYAEFSAWDPGVARVAEELGRSEAYTTASKIDFSIWDLDGDGNLNNREMRNAMARDFRRADLDDDGFLDKAAFIGGFTILVAMRAAIRPDL